MIVKKIRASLKPVLTSVVFLLMLLILVGCPTTAGTQVGTLILSYDGNQNTGGIVPVDSNRYNNGDKAIVAANTGKLSRAGSTFDGWNTKADKTGSTFQPGAELLIGEDTTLYAMWSGLPTGGGTITPSVEDYTKVFVENMSLPLAVREYYRPAYGLAGSALKAKLKEIITTSHSAKTYTPGVWTMFKTSDLIPGTIDATYTYGKVWDMYSSTSATGASAAYWFKMVTNQDTGAGSVEGYAYNREHSWPKSTFGGVDESVPGTDGHHLVATDKIVNGKRSNHPYAEVAVASWTSQNGSKLGTVKATINYTGSDTEVFEPIDIYKGDFARMHFYMALRYYNDAGFLNCDWASAGAKLKPWYDIMLQRWDDSDPVSAKETTRNDAVQAHQGNRNPFIDYPELAEMIDLIN